LALFDFPGCGNSKGEYVTYGLSEKFDVDSILRRLEAEIGYKEFYIWGRSMGAAVAILYASHFLSSKSNKKKLKKNKSKSSLKKQKNKKENNENKETLMEIGMRNKVKALIIDSAFTNLFVMLQGWSQDIYLTFQICLKARVKFRNF
jgi:pimeloyl-ACP methyl ester carboxylesterase